MLYGIKVGERWAHVTQDGFWSLWDDATGARWWTDQWDAIAALESSPNPVRFEGRVSALPSAFVHLTTGAR